MTTVLDQTTPPDPAGRPLRDVALVCLPPAGGSASMVRPWLPHLDPGLVPVTPNVRKLLAQVSTSPGRRPAEEGGDLRAVAQLIAEGLPDSPYVIVGHSLGGLLAVEAARARQASDRRQPSAVVVMASRPPGHGTARLFRPLMGLDDSGFLERMVGLGAASPELVDHPARALFLAPLRADIRLVSGYDPADHGTWTLQAPLHAWHAEGDALAPPELARRWSAYAGVGWGTRIIPGTHAFPSERGELVAQWLNELVRTVPEGR